MSQLYEIVIYTTNLEVYAQEILKRIDKKQRISHLLFKDKCLTINKLHFLKSMKVLGRNPDNVIFIDVLPTNSA
jgi:TFIIF-interacting CTD phosphatase-like protein